MKHAWPVTSSVVRPLRRPVTASTGHRRTSASQPRACTHSPVPRPHLRPRRVRRAATPSACCASSAGGVGRVGGGRLRRRVVRARRHAVGDPAHDRRDTWRRSRYRDELEVRTWVSDMRRVRSQREYEVRRAGDDGRWSRARVDRLGVRRSRPRRARFGRRTRCASALMPEGVGSAAAPAASRRRRRRTPSAPRGASSSPISTPSRTSTTRSTRSTSSRRCATRWPRAAGASIRRTRTARLRARRARPRVLRRSALRRPAGRRRLGDGHRRRPLRHRLPARPRRPALAPRPQHLALAGRSGGRVPAAGRRLAGRARLIPPRFSPTCNRLVTETE